MADQIVFYAFVVISGISTFLVVLQAFGLCPPFIWKIINRNRATEVIEVLKELGVDVDKYKRVAVASNIPSYGYDKEKLKQSLKTDLLKVALKGEISIGQRRNASGKIYINVMGASSDYRNAEVYARYLSTFFHIILDEGTTVSEPNFDFIVTPKMGSPLVGYEFSKLINKPLLLHNRTPKFISSDFNVEQVFDFNGSPPPKGSKALLVDDSTTGGTKMVEAIDDLRKFGYDASDCLILFEPIVKDVRTRLQSKNVSLHSILKLNSEGFIHEG